MIYIPKTLDLLNLILASEPCQDALKQPNFCDLNPDKR